MAASGGIERRRSLALRIPNPPATDHRHPALRAWRRWACAN